MNRKMFVAGNWKMNLSLNDGEKLCEEIKASLAELEFDNKVDVVLFPPFVHLDRLYQKLDSTGIKIGAQNIHHEKSGAYTGEISADMIHSCGAAYCLVGHSERRIYQAESDTQLLAKVNLLLANNIQPIFCLGESLADRESGQEKPVIAKQLSALFKLDKNDIAKLILAYEPVWAIGTGKTASVDQAQAMHAFIREEFSKQFGQAAAEKCTILYGGSCKPENAKDLFQMKDVDGGLIGGASLKADSFVDIVTAAL